MEFIELDSIVEGNAQDFDQIGATLSQLIIVVKANILSNKVVKANKPKKKNNNKG